MGIVYAFSIDVVSNAKYLFPSYKGYTNETIDKKASIYIQIESKSKLYQEIQNKIDARKKNAQWIVDNVLYTRTVKDLKASQEAVKKPLSIDDFKLQAVFSKHKVAIISGHLVKESSRLYGVHILKIQKDSVLLDYKKGKKWIYLFH
jgi:hypothetical protein